MSKQRKREDPGREERTVYQPAWVAVVWVNPDLIGRIQRDGTPVADMWPASMKRIADPEPDRQAIADEPELEAGA